MLAIEQMQTATVAGRQIKVRFALLVYFYVHCVIFYSPVFYLLLDSYMRVTCINVPVAR